MNLERLKAFSIGTIAAVGAYVAFQRDIWRNAAQISYIYGTATIEKEPLPSEEFFGPKIRGSMVRKWNAVVDDTVGSVATLLAEKGI
eukprot:CAMPEP_0175076424 /NCGR_PEP_ID=MMETSP0052_2-20121109/22719_1 /TAXON_ID=51329 ORGANISM="Polytomella parva, Strain SAG 63-3" /NCGR_SAMPLE_ID=MMETSP0052_2 /ASSEMBLY_ACC=CAM_ASM_000194 /LENGTH=86 /DNA_ID=CAMNT_0016345561 /DNA_START=39 /DNA_END=299 /DNA_ORIENTATION=-